MNQTKTQEINKIKISVRNLVEFILRSGDLDNRRIGRSSLEAMQEGSRIHRKIQKRMGANYTPEVSLSIDIPITRNGVEFEIKVEGRCDGILYEKNKDTNLPSYLIDEIKGVYMDLDYLKEPIQVHKAQAMCYGYIYGAQENLEEVGIRITYCNLETESIKYFDESFKTSKLKEWFYDLVNEYSKWAYWQYNWSIIRNQSIKDLSFPFEYRQGQKNLVADVYRSIIREKRLFIQAPTGVGKTIATLFPTIKGIGEKEVSKIFYLTAKTITRSVAEETVKILRQKALS